MWCHFHGPKDLYCMAGRLEGSHDMDKRSPVKPRWEFRAVCCCSFWIQQSWFWIRGWYWYIESAWQSDFRVVGTYWTFFFKVGYLVEKSLNYRSPRTSDYNGAIATDYLKAGPCSRFAFLLNGTEWNAVVTILAQSGIDYLDEPKWKKGSSRVLIQALCRLWK